MAKTIEEQIREASSAELEEELKRRRAPALQHCATDEIEEELLRRQKRCWESVRAISDSPPKLVEK